ncbi:unnamed protein product, partial [Allacma fusca]
MEGQVYDKETFVLIMLENPHLGEAGTTTQSQTPEPKAHFSGAAPTGRITTPVSHESKELQQLYKDDTLNRPSKIDVVEIESSDEEHPMRVNPKQDQQTNWKNIMKSRAAMQS